MADRQQVEKMQQISDLKVQLQMAAMEAAAAKAEAEKARQQLEDMLKKKNDTHDGDRRADDYGRSKK